MAPTTSYAIWMIKRFFCVCISCEKLLLDSFQLIVNSNLVFTLELLSQNSVIGAKTCVIFSDLRTLRQTWSFLEQFSY